MASNNTEFWAKMSEIRNKLEYNLKGKIFQNPLKNRNKSDAKLKNNLKITKNKKDKLLFLKEKNMISNCLKTFFNKIDELKLEINKDDLNILKMAKETFKSRNLLEYIKFINKVSSTLDKNDIVTSLSEKFIRELNEADNENNLNKINKEIKMIVKKELML